MIGIVCGHTQESQGAINYLDESEYVFNSRIAKKLFVLSKEAKLGAVILKRGTGSYKMQCEHVSEFCKLYDVKSTLHLHFNDYWNKNVVGCEVLSHHSNLDVASEISERLSRCFEIKNRGAKEPKRGSLMVNLLNQNSIDAYIIEPCFAGFRNKQSISIMENEDRYVRFLLDTLKRLT